jgi:hypothetical protein
LQQLQHQHQAVALSSTPVCCPRPSHGSSLAGPAHLQGWRRTAAAAGPVPQSCQQELQPGLPPTQPQTPQGCVARCLDAALGLVAVLAAAGQLLLLLLSSVPCAARCCQRLLPQAGGAQQSSCGWL